MAGEARPVTSVRTVLAVFLVLLAAAYALVATLYSPGGDLEVGSSDQGSPDVIVRVEVMGVNPASYSALLRLRVVEVAADLLNADERIASPLRIAVTSSDGTDDFTFPAGTALGRAEVTVGVNGEESDYPFDRHDSAVTIDAAVLDGGEGGSVARPVPVGVEIVGGVSGWDTTANVAPAAGDASLVALAFERSFSTIFFAILLVLMAFVIAVFSFTVGTAVLTGRQPVDSSIVGWGAALLFALLALRYYLPGDPPIGSSVDVYAYMWITLTAFVGLAMNVTMWLRRRWEPDDGGVGPGAAQAAPAEDGQAVGDDADAASGSADGDDSA